MTDIHPVPITLSSHYNLIGLHPVPMTTSLINTQFPLHPVPMTSSPIHTQFPLHPDRHKCHSYYMNMMKLNTYPSLIYTQFPLHPVPMTPTPIHTEFPLHLERHKWYSYYMKLNTYPSPIESYLIQTHIPLHALYIFSSLHWLVYILFLWHLAW